MPTFTRWMLAAAIAAAAVPAIAASDFQAGQWRHETKLVSAELPGVPQSLVKLFAGRGARTSCNSAADLAGHAETLLTADDRASCKLRKLSMTNGDLVFDTFCTNKRFPDGLLVSSRGTYTPASYSITTTSTGTKDGKAVKIVTTGVGKRVADSCKKP